MSASGGQIFAFFFLFFFLLRRLSATLKFAFRALAAGGGAASALPSAVAISTMVDIYAKIRTYFKENC